MARIKTNKEVDFPEPYYEIDAHGYTYLPPMFRAQREYMQDFIRKHATYDEIAEVLGLSSNSIRNWVSCRNYLPLHHALKMEKHFKEKQITFWRYIRKYWRHDV